MSIVKLRIILLLMSLTLISACGFHLRGDYQIPPSLMNLHLSSSDEFAPLTKMIKEQLNHNRVKLVPPDTDIPNLIIGDEQISNRILSLYSTGEVAEYEISYQVQVILRRKGFNDQFLSIKRHRDYIDNPLAALAKSRERALIINEFRTLTSEQILRQLASME